MRIRYLLLNAYGTGGTIRTVVNQANFMAAAGHDVELVSVLRRTDEILFPIDARIPVRTLVDERDGVAQNTGSRGLAARFHTARRDRLSQEIPSHIPPGEFGVRHFNRYIEKKTIQYLRQLRDGVLVTTRPALNILAAQYATPGVIRVAQEHMNLGTHRKDVRAAIARHYPPFDAVAVLTHRDREDYQRLLPGTRVVRIPNAVHSVDQTPATCTNKIVVAAGRLCPQKGFDLLIPAFKRAVDQHPAWQLRVFGIGERKTELRELIEEHHLYNHVFLMGHTQRLDAELAKASLYVLSSRFEGLPMVLAEAMTHALPVVSFDCPTGPADVLTHGREGFLVPPEDVDALGDAMARLMGDEDLRAEMGDAALHTAQGFSPAVVLPQWEELFTALQAAPRGPAPRRGRLTLAAEHGPA